MAGETNDVYSGMELSRQAEAAKEAGNPDLAKQKLDQLVRGDLPPAPPFKPVKTSWWQRFLWKFRGNKSSELPVVPNSPTAPADISELPSSPALKPPLKQAA